MYTVYGSLIEGLTHTTSHVLKGNTLILTPDDILPMVPMVAGFLFTRTSREYIRPRPPRTCNYCTIMSRVQTTSLAIIAQVCEGETKRLGDEGLPVCCQCE